MILSRISLNRFEDCFEKKFQIPSISLKFKFLISIQESLQCFFRYLLKFFSNLILNLFFHAWKNYIFRRMKKKRVVLSREEEERVFSWNDDLEYDLSWCAVPRGINFFLLPQTGDTFVFAVCDPRGSKNVSHFRRFVLIYGARSTPRKWKRTLFLGREEPVKRHERWNTRHFHAMTFQVSRTTNLHPSKNCSITFQIFVFRRQIESFHDYYYPSRGIIMIKPLNVFIDSINCVFELNYYIGLTKLVSVLK